MKRLLACLLFLVLVPGGWSGLAQTKTQPQPPVVKKALDHDCYDLWNTIFDAKLSDNGQWLHYTLKSGKGDTTLVIRQTGSDKQFTIPRGALPRFSKDGKYAVYLIGADKKDDDKDKGNDDVGQAFQPVSAFDQPTDPKPAPPTGKALGILDLQTGKTTTIPKVSSYRMPDKGNWIAYLVPDVDDKKPDAKPMKPNEGSKPPKPGFPGKTVTAKPKPGDLVLRHLDTGAETKYADALSYSVSDDGARLAFFGTDKDNKKTSVNVVSSANGERLKLMEDEAKYNSLTFADSGDKLAFLSSRDDLKAKKPGFSLYLWQVGWKDAQALVTPAKGLPAGYGVAPGRQPNFSKNGQRLFFGLSELPKQEAKKSKADKNLDKVKVDIWHWKDPQLQPMQLVQIGKEQFRSYLAMLPLDKGAAVQLGTKEVPDVVVGAVGDGDVAIGSSDMPYQKLMSWDSPGYRDVYLIDVKSGDRQKVLTKAQSFVTLSPGGKYLTWWDGTAKAWMALSVKDRKTINLTRLLPCAVHDELHDTPAQPPAYGTAGWVKDDKAILIYDAHDIWAVDPESVLPPVCVTDKHGREKHLRFRYEKLDPKQQAIDPSQPMLLSAFDVKTKSQSYYHDQVSSTAPPERLFICNENLDVKQKAKAANKLLMTRSSFHKFPDLWVCDTQFKGLKQLSQANPQQKDYSWGTSELVEWCSLDGAALNGILYKPDNFDAKKQYPMLVYFYERMSDKLHQHYVPAPSRSSINVSFYVSRGYLVFIPDIPYKVGHPGQSCVNAVLPGVTSLIAKGFVDAKKIGVQGHSWGGYQIAHMLTKTKLFAAAEAGAPVSNMTSAYGGIRWSTGMSRMFQYEKTQSRIGGTLWSAQQLFIENSPIFSADCIETPLLMLHNDKDGAVPWYQGIELFVALRRLEKPCWMVNYNGEDHGLLKRENQIDWSIRLQQFFDHYLKGDPPPVWLADGVPATQKGKTLGLDLVQPDGE